MGKFDFKESMQKGSMMVEALAMLGLITMVTPIIYKKAAERTTELQDINVATQMRMVSNAVDEYISDNYRSITEGEGVEGVTKIAVEGEKLNKLKEYLPQGFDTSKSKLFDDYEISIVRKNVKDKNDNLHSVYTSAILAPLRDDMTIMRSNKIASMIGANGGVYRGGSDKKVEGSQNAWVGKLDDYGLGGSSPKEGSLMVISTNAIASAKGDVTSDEALFRIADGSDGGPESKNRMQTELYMGGNTVREIVSLIAKSGTPQIMVGGPDPTDPGTGQTTGLLVQGATNLNDALTQEGGAVSFTHKGFTATTQENDATVIKSTGTGKIELQATDSGAINIESKKGALNVEAKEADVTVKAGGTDKPQNVEISAAGKAVNIKAKNSHIYVNSNSSDEGGGGAIEISSTGKSEFIGGDVHLTSVNEYITGGKKLVLTDTTNIDDYPAKGTVSKSIILANGMTARDEVIVLKNHFSVGGEPGDDDNTVEITPTSSYIGRGGTTGGMEVTNDSLVVGNPNNTMTMTSGGKFEVVNSTDNKLTMSGTDVELENKYNSLTYSASGLVLKNQGDNSVHSPNSLTMTKGGGLKLSSTQSTNTSPENYLEMAKDGGKVTLKQNVNSIDMNGATNFTLSHNGGAAGGAKINMAGTTLTASVDENTTKFYADTTKIGFENGTNQSAYLTSGGVLNVDSDSFIADENGIAVGVDINAKSVELDGNSVGVVIRREGYIEIKAPTGTNASNGYIKARRLVSDVAYPTEAAFDGYTVDGSTPTKGYDFYQVNPAYTSVMNDIKLATRGGARLSDILPDYINKGMYVVDNTYDNATVGAWAITVGSGDNAVDYGKHELVTSTTIDECETANCVASPWMGYIPAPQCPKNYAKAITLTPFRWRMAEVFALYDNTKDWSEIVSDDTSYRNALTDSKEFVKYFQQPNDPAKAMFKLASGSDASSNDHTHDVEGDHPVTFQTNTWLNTAIPLVYKDNEYGVHGSFIGWHAVMGFIYKPAHYDAMVKDAKLWTDASGNPTGEYPEDGILWNIFPVYVQDNAAIASVYCYFERHPITSGTERKWNWGAPVYKYDQLHNFRGGNVKNTTVGDAAGLSNNDLNDPTLGYDDAW